VKQINSENYYSVEGSVEVVLGEWSSLVGEPAGHFDLPLRLPAAETADAADN